MKGNVTYDAAKISVLKGCSNRYDNDNGKVLHKINNGNKRIECEHYKRKCKFYVSKVMSCFGGRV